MLYICHIVAVCNSNVFCLPQLNIFTREDPLSVIRAQVVVTSDQESVVGYEGMCEGEQVSGSPSCWEMKVNKCVVAGKTRGLDSGQKAGASTVNHQFRYSSMICLHIVSMFPQTDPVF